MRAGNAGIRAGICAAALACGLALAGGVPPPAEETPQVPVDIVLRATGKGHPPETAVGPQAELMAERAAVVVALRNLAAKLGRTRVDPKTGTIDLEAFLAGYRLADRRYERDARGTVKSVEATVEISLDRIYGNVHRVLAAQLEEARARQAASQQALDTAQGDLTRAGAAAEAAASEVQALKANLARAEQGLAEARNRSAVLEAANADREARIANLEAQLAAVKEDLAKAREELKRLRGEGP